MPEQARRVSDPSCAIYRFRLLCPERRQRIDRSGHIEEGGVTATTVEPPAQARTPKAKPATAPKPNKPSAKRPPKANGDQEDGGRMSCLAAAAKVLEEAGEPMNTKAMVEAMAAKGYWTSDAPTPWATLCSALLREQQKKGDASRFTKVERGLFTLAKGA
jgi:hypothetical protein